MTDQKKLTSLDRLKVEHSMLLDQIYSLRDLRDQMDKLRAKKATLLNEQSNIAKETGLLYDELADAQERLKLATNAQRGIKLKSRKLQSEQIQSRHMGVCLKENAVFNKHMAWKIAKREIDEIDNEIDSVIYCLDKTNGLDKTKINKRLREIEDQIKVLMYSVPSQQTDGKISDLLERRTASLALKDDLDNER